MTGVDSVAVEEYDQVGRAVDDDDHVGQHAALKNMCVMDCDTEQRIVPNGPPVPIENDCFSGHVMLLIRTPDVDDRNADNDGVGMMNTMHETPLRISRYFRGKKRRFEFQFQIRLKKVPQGPLFLGCELEHPIKVGGLTKGLVGILLAMVRRINPGFHYSWGCEQSKVDPDDLATGNYEKTHLSFPVEASMDRIVITKGGTEPPELGYELEESNESVRRRRKMGAGSVDWNLEDTYTMCLWSAYADWIKWKSLNVPGVSPFSLCRVTGQQPIYLCVYELPHVTPAEYRRQRPPHKRKDLVVYTRLEFSHEEKTVGGLSDSVLGTGKGSRRALHMDTEAETESITDSDIETLSHITT